MSGGAEAAGVSGPEVAVIGAGVAGPAAALFLTGLGYRATIYEARAGDEEWLGSYVSLADNGRDVLHRLGLLAEAEHAGTPTARIEFRNHTGTVLGVNEEAGTLIRRDRLGGVLRAAARQRGVRIEYDRRLTELSEERGRVRASFANGTTITADALIGGDGIHSKVRRLLFPEHPPVRYTGVVDGGGVCGPVPGIVADGTLRLTYGRSAFFGYQGLPSGEVVWFQSLSDPDGDDAPRNADLAQWRDRLRALHGADHSPIPEVVDAAHGPVVRWPVLELAPLAAWSKGRVCLIGDAAHAMEPHDGQSASMALEDALVLARCLDEDGLDRAAFERFTELRKERVEAVAAGSRRTGALKFPGTDRERRARDVILSMYLATGISASADRSRQRVDRNPR
jgi:2-polyprenyl-6-methoxyphenol hydroxylase-like FAD-dependent oxidoreductase